ncbi:MAG: hypothetical protein AABX63_01630 [Nanoarchaeota archaeon]
MKLKEKKRESGGKELFSYDNAIKLIAILIIVAIARAAFTLDKAPAAAKADLEQEAIQVLRTLTDKNMPISVLESNELVEEKVEYLERMGYDEIKSMVGIKSDFCIFFEDITGNLAQVNEVKSGIGSNKIYINGRPCK